MGANIVSFLILHKTFYLYFLLFILAKMNLNYEFDY